MITQRRAKGIRRMLGGLTALLVATGAGAAAGATAEEERIVEAVFADASPLLAGYTVRSHGVRVGEIESISVQNGAALVRMRVDATAFPMHTDATAEIRPVSLLGERFVDLDRGSPDAPEADPEVPIPVERTSSAVELNEVLDTVDDPTGTALSALLTATGEGVAGRGADIDAALAALEPALGDTNRLLALLREQNDVLAGLIDKAAPVADNIAENDGADLDRLLDSTNLLLGTVAQRSEALDATLERLPTTLTDARTTLTQLAVVAEEGTATLGALRPFTDRLPQISTELQGFTDSADPALASLDPVLAHGRRLLDEAGPLVQTLRPAGSDLRGVAASARPLVDGLTVNFADVVGFIRNWAMATSGFDGLSHYFRGVVILDEDTGTGLLPAPVADAAQVPGIPGPLDEGLPSAGTDPTNATGLSPEQEQSLVGQLMGVE